MEILRYKHFEAKDIEIEVRFREKHGYKYDYSLVDYRNMKTKVKIICTKHGIFWQSPYLHLRGSGCPICSGKYKKSTDEFIEDAISIHGNKYDYSSAEYKNNKTKLKIICPKHGEFYQKPCDHINKKTNCPKCTLRYKKTNDDFIRDATKIHGNKYDYSNVEFTGSHDKVKIGCPTHGYFLMSYNSHVTKLYGCPICQETSGESYVRNFLNAHGIDFEAQKEFENCKNIKKLKFDFYLPEYRSVIEYDGRHHFIPIFGGEDGLRLIKHRDQIKNEYCLDNNIQIFRIKYSDDIQKSLENIIHKLSKVEESKSNKKRIKKVIIDEFVIFYGSDADSNDYITIEMSSVEDIWLHAKGVPGSHVLIKVSDKLPTLEVIKKAAQIAADNSKGNSGSEVTVVYCKRRFVHKRPGMNPGQVEVEYKNSNQIIVTKK